MDETKNTNQGDPQTSGQPSGGNTGSTSKNPKTYTEEEVKILTEKVRSDVLAEAGRKYKPMEDENTTLKSQLSNNQKLIQETEQKITKLQAEIDEMLEDDPDAERYIKKLRELQDQEQKLKTDRTALEADRNEVQLYKRNKYIDEIVKGYEGLETARLTTLCDKLNLTTKEQITVAAETIGTRKTPPAEPSTPSFKTDSGATNGGGIDTSTLSPRQKIVYGLQQAQKNKK